MLVVHPYARGTTLHSLVVQTVLLYKSTPYAGGTNSCFLSQLFTLEVETVAFLSHPDVADTNTDSCFINQIPMLEVQIVAF